MSARTLITVTVEACPCGRVPLHPVERAKCPRCGRVPPVRVTRAGDEPIMARVEWTVERAS
ncbi:MAG: hypothetical protein IT348_05855 [Candidatus Eisenbacteria bacterium]|nr:hypothetical protein [Candidatus Eisenbacteria bacterium]